MNHKPLFSKLHLFVFLALSLLYCSTSETSTYAAPPDGDGANGGDDNGNGGSGTVQYAEIDFSNWKVTLPVDEDNNGSPDEYYSDTLINYGYQALEPVQPFMYDDTEDSSLIFYAYPDVSTTNSSYSRTELRELINPENARENWTLLEGGEMTGRLKVQEVSEATQSNYDYHRVIVMQIHGRLTNAQRDLIGEDDNNAPPMLKIYWDNGKIRVKTKLLKNLNATVPELLHEDAWDNDDGFNFEEDVGFRKFTLEVKVSEGKMVIVLNGNEFKVYENIHMRKWGVFENYFKAGNYFQSRDKGAYAKVRYYELEVSH